MRRAQPQAGFWRRSRWSPESSYLYYTTNCVWLIDQFPKLTNKFKLESFNLPICARCGFCWETWLKKAPKFQQILQTCPKPTSIGYELRGFRISGQSNFRPPKVQKIRPNQKKTATFTQLFEGFYCWISISSQLSFCGPMQRCHRLKHIILGGTFRSAWFLRDGGKDPNWQKQHTNMDTTSRKWGLKFINWEKYHHLKPFISKVFCWLIHSQR